MNNKTLNAIHCHFLKNKKDCCNANILFYSIENVYRKAEMDMIESRQFNRYNPIIEHTSKIVCSRKEKDREFER